MTDEWGGETTTTDQPAEPKRTVVARLYLPMGMGAFSRILSAIAKEFPGAVLSEPSAEGEVVVSA